MGSTQAPPRTGAWPVGAWGVRVSAAHRKQAVGSGQWIGRTHLDVVVGVCGEPMVGALWQNDHVAGLQFDANPCVLFVPDIEVATSLNAVADLLVVVDVLCEK